jgi:hypothetical protein
MWKASSALTGWVGGGMLLMVGSFNQQVVESKNQFFVIIIGFAMMIASGLFALMAIRCPKCKARWVRTAIRDSSVGSWLLNLCTSQECPVCKYRPDYKETR